MMSQDQKREMVEVIRPRYLKANARGKEQTLDEFICEAEYRAPWSVGSKPQEVAGALAFAKYPVSLLRG